VGQRNGFADMKAEQAKMTASWKAEGRLSEACVVADPEIAEFVFCGSRLWQGSGAPWSKPWEYAPSALKVQ
jgi:hypothetical protein